VRGRRAAARSGPAPGTGVAAPLTGSATHGTSPDSPRRVYIHVPFCREKCDYCGFYSVAAKLPAADGVGVDRGRWVERREAFIAAAHAEWAAEAARQRVRRLETVYVGGGTPSLLGEEGLERLLAPFFAGRSPRGTRLPLLTERAEVTVETNPEDVTPGYAAWAAARRVRAGLGGHCFDRGLRSPRGGRAAADPVAAFALLRDAGVVNLGVDLIFGVPGQTSADVDRELAVVAALGPDHVSWYELDVEPGTRLAQRVGGDAVAADAAELYRRLVAGLERLGYGWYEVSNFARPGRRSRHNLAYWRGRPYLGLGPSAVSTVGDLRWRNAADVERYVGAWTEGAPPRETEYLDAATRARERLLLAARIGARVELSELDPALDRAALQPLAGAGFISLQGGTLSLTRKGRYVANEVCVRLFRDYFYGG